MKNKAFTLVELLVVVLIIGILAAIAVPQYQVAVAKSEYSTLKVKTKALAEAVNRYQLASGQYPWEFGDLDISLPNVTRSPKASDTTESIWVFFNKEGPCAMWRSGYDKIYCSTSNGKMRFYFDFNKLQPFQCLTRKNYEVGHKVCQQETGKTKEEAMCINENNYCNYYY